MKLAILGTTEATDDYSQDPVPSAFLLNLLHEGYEVLIVSGKSKPSLWDTGWMQVVPPENRYFIGRLPLDPMAASSPEYREPYIKVFERLGLTPPDDAADWIDFKEAATRQGVITNETQFLTLQLTEAYEKHGETTVFQDPEAEYEDIVSWIKQQWRLSRYMQDDELMELLEAYAEVRRIKIRPRRWR